MAVFSKGKKEKYQRIASLIGEGTDYNVYDMTIIDRLAAFGIGAAVGGVVSWIFFGNIIITIVIALAGSVAAQDIYRSVRLEKRKKNLLLQFKDVLEALTSSYGVGKNSLEAFTDTLTDMEYIYGERSDIYNELYIIVSGMRNNIRIEDLLANLAKRSGLDDIESFADVFRVAVRQGANINAIIGSTRDIIIDKMEIEMEIDTILSGSKNELNIMMVMPLIVMVGMGGLGDGYGASNNSFANFIVKIIVLCMFGAAYWIGKKITDIKI